MAKRFSSSWRTTALGFLVFLSEVSEVLLAALDPERSGLATLRQDEAIQGIATALAICLLGVTARDDVVSSEGTRAPKAKAKRA